MVYFIDLLCKCFIKMIRAVSGYTTIINNQHGQINKPMCLGNCNEISRRWKDPSAARQEGPVRLWLLFYFLQQTLSSSRHGLPPPCCFTPIISFTFLVDAAPEGELQMLLSFYLLSPFRPNPFLLLSDKRPHGTLHVNTNLLWHGVVPFFLVCLYSASFPI